MRTKHLRIPGRAFGICCSLYAAIVVGLPSAAEAQKDDGGTPPLIRHMVGMWNVQEWMWPAAGAVAVSLPPALAQRQLIGDGFVQEIMKTPAGSKDQFTRVSYFGFNGVNQQYEYFSIDTRAPQMMNERGGGANRETSGSGTINLLGEMFVAPQWGQAKNAAFRYRLTVGEVKDSTQTVDLYLTPLSTASRREFLAFRYKYTLQH